MRSTPGDDVIAVMRVWGHGKRSGAPVETRQSHVWTVRGGQALAAPGLRHQGRGPQSRGAGGVGGVAGECGADPANGRCLNRRDWDACVSLADEQIEVESRQVAVDGGYHGHDGLRQWWDSFLGAFPDYIAEVVGVRDLGDVTLSRVEGFGHGAASGIPMADPVWMPTRWRDGRCLWWRICATEAEALKAVGLEE